METVVPQSTARRVAFKAFLSADHVSPATGKTIDVVIAKNCADFDDPDAGATTATEDEFGWYHVDLVDDDFDTTGPLVVRGTEADIDPVEVKYYVVAGGAAALTESSLVDGVAILTALSYILSLVGG